MSWFADARQAWIAEMLVVYGFINRDHLMRKFRISQPQASMDLVRFAAENRGLMVYNVHTKRYENPRFH